MNLAIEGHSTQGSEVIARLKMLGGMNTFNLNGSETNCYYYINDNNKIYHCLGIDPRNYIYYTLEEFLEKFPYKVGDKVQYKGATSCGSIFEVEEMRWEENTVKYTLCLFGCNYKRSTLPAEYLQPYKEETMEEDKKAKGYCTEEPEDSGKTKKIAWFTFWDNDFADEVELYLKDRELVQKDGKWFVVKKNSSQVNLKELERKLDEALAKETTESLNKWLDGEPEPKAPILSNRYDYAKGKCGYVIPNGYEFDSIKQGFQTEIILRPIKLQYPKTYVECAKILESFITTYVDGYKSELLEKFHKLLICRDAYWKIAGEQMGLGKDWKPDWTNANERKYCIVNTMGKVEKWVQKTTNKIFAFPTEEMRDAFYENFKDLIENCKELL